MKISLIILVLLFSLKATGQGNESSTSKEWHVGLGYQNLRVLDINTSPFIYVSNNGFLEFSLQKKKPTKMWHIGASLAIGSNQSKRFGKREITLYDHYSINGTRDSIINILNPDLSSIQADITYGHYWRLNMNSREAYLGGQLKDHFFYSALGADVWFLNQLSMMPSVRMNLVNTSKSALFTEISIPLITYIVKQPYALDPSLPENSYFKAYLITGSSLATINTFQQLDFKLDYSYTLNKGRKIGAGYKFMWMNYSKIPNRRLGAYANTILITFKF